MSSDNLLTRTNGQTIDETWFMRIKRALTGTVVPRDVTSLDALANAGSLGSATYRFKRAHISSGFLCPGMMKLRYQYPDILFNDDADLAGWMLCEGVTVSQAHYDTRHGAGKWAAEISSSPLNGLMLPDFTGTAGTAFLKGITTATADGLGALLQSGALTIDLSHFHGPGGVVTSGPPSTAGASKNTTLGSAQFWAGGAHTHTFSVVTNLSASQSIKPKSIILQVYMRII